MKCIVLLSLAIALFSTVLAAAITGKPSVVGVLVSFSVAFVVSAATLYFLERHAL